MRKRLKNFGNASEKKDETIQLNKVFKFFENRERLKKKEETPQLNKLFKFFV